MEGRGKVPSSETLPFAHRRLVSWDVYRELHSKLRPGVGQYALRYARCLLVWAPRSDERRSQFRAGWFTCTGNFR